MKARINYKSKKTIIIIAIAVVLLIAAITGTVAYIKGNNNAAAAMENTEVTEPANNGNDSNNNGGVENPNTPNTDNPEQIPIIDDNQNPTTPAQNGDTTTNPGTTTNQGTTTGTTTGNAGTTVPDTEYTQTTVVENPWKTEDITWAPISLQARTETAGLNINTPDLEVTKTAYVGNQEITAEPTNTVVQPGQEITYVIRIKNTGNLPTSTIRTIDAIPDGTEIVDKTISEDGVLANGKITWKNVIAAGETVELSFKVKVISEKEITLISNTAKVNGEDTPTTETPVVTTAKEAYLVVDGELAEATSAKVGDTLRYVITITNNSNVPGKTTVTDTIPDGTEIVDRTIPEGGKLDGRTITWNDVAVKANGETTVSFNVIINKETAAGEVVKEVTNAAIVGEKETPQVITPVANITTVKSSTPSSKPLHELDRITYTLTATNSGNAEGTVVLTDTIPEGTTLVSIAGDGVESKGTITWNVVVPAKKGEVDGKVEVSFTVKINSFESETKTILNDQAKQDGNSTNSTTDTAEKVYVDITVNKKWKDEGIQKQRRPSQIRFELYAGNELKDSYVMNINQNDDEYTHTFKKKPKYNSEGERITYTVQEKEINKEDLKFYQSGCLESEDSDGNKTYNFTNTFTRPGDKKTVTVTKIWNDNNDAAAKRPDNVILQLNGENVELTTKDAKLNNGDIWSTEIEVDVYNNDGEEIEYTVTEDQVPQWYEKYEQGTTVKNTFKAPIYKTKDITLTKIWVDSNDKAKKRPTSVKFDLYKIGVDGTEVLVESGIELKKGNNNDDEWTITRNVQEYDEKANEIKYFVKEETTGSIFYIKDDKDPTDLTITNKFSVPEDKAVVSVKKVWNDKGNTTKRKDVTIRVTGEDGKYEDIVLTKQDANINNGGSVWEKNNVTTNLPKYDSLGDLIDYTFDEVNIPDGYIRTVKDNEITNSLPGIEVTKTVSKVQGMDAKEMNEITVKTDDVIEYEITVTNIGTIPLRNLTVTDNLNVYLNKDHPEITTTKLSENETLDIGETKKYTVYYKVTAEDAKLGSQLLTNIATANAKYEDSNGNEQNLEDYAKADVEIQDLPRIEIDKTQKVNGNDVTDKTKVQPGDVIDYIITVTNTGNTVLKNVTVTDSMSSNDKFELIEGNWYIGELGIAPNNVATIKARYEVQKADMKEEESIVKNVATVKTTSTEPKSDEVEVITEVWKSEITVEKTSELIQKANGNTIEGKAEYGDTIKYTITATNAGRKQGTIDVTDGVPTGTKLKTSNNDTNLTEAELAKLAEGGRVTRTLAVPGNDGTGNNTASIFFEVIVTAKPGEKIQNMASASDGTEPKDPGYNVEKKVSVKKNTRIPKIKNSNVVIVLDVSGSMNYKPNGKQTANKEETRLYAAQQACNSLIDSMFKDDSTGCQVSVVTFSSGKGWVPGYPYWGDVDNATLQGTATNSSEATTLKNTINDITANGGTRIAAGINEANTEINRLAEKNKNNQNIVIVLSDGDFKVNKGNGEIYKSAGETESRVKTASRDLKTSKCAPTVYAVAFASSETGLMKNTIASDANKTFKTASDYTALLGIFTEIGSEIGGGEKVEVESNGGLIELPGLDENEDITIKLNGDTTGTTGRFGDDFFKDKIIKLEADGKYYLNTKAEGFGAGDKIEIEYCEVEQGN